MGGDPAAGGQRLVDDLDGTAVRGPDGRGLSPFDLAEHAETIGVDVAHERSGGLAVRDDLAEAAAGLYHFGRQAVHVDVALVADDQPLRTIEQQQALRHVVDGGVQALLFKRQALFRQPVLPRQLAHDEEQQGRDHQRRESGCRDQEPGLSAPISQRRRQRCGRDDDNRKIRQRKCGTEPGLSVDGANQLLCGEAGPRLGAQAQGTRFEYAADHRIYMGIARQQRAIMM